LKNKKLTILLTLSALLSSSLGTLFAINKAIEKLATTKGLLDHRKKETYHWRFGDVSYSVSGEGKPVLLIHDLTPGSSSIEWAYLVPELSKTHTVYLIDLPGCGLSERPSVTYTSYMYTQLVNDFIHDIIKKRSFVVATGNSAAFVIEACGINEKAFEDLILINPESIRTFRKAPSKRTKSAVFILKLKIIGTFIYNMVTTRKAIEKTFEDDYFYDKDKFSDALVDYYYESAHLGGLSEKNLHISQIGRYTNANIVRSLKSINKNIHILCSAELPDMHKKMKEYQYYNPAIEVEYLDYVKRLPQLETPDEILKYLQLYLSPEE